MATGGRTGPLPRISLLKVALVSSGSGSRGGGEIYLALLAPGLVELGCQVEAIIPDLPRMDELADSLAPHARIHRVAFVPTYERRTRVLGALFDVGQQARMADIFRQVAPDVLHVNQQVAEDGCDLLFAARRSGLPWISTIHVGRSASELGAIVGPARDWLTQQALKAVKGRHIAVSNGSRNQLLARFSGIESQFHTVHNGAEAPDPGALKRARAEARAAWGVGDNEIVIGSVGRIEAQKNPTGFVDAIARLSDKRAIRGVWIGDGSLREAMKARSDHAGVRLQVDGWRDDAALRMAGFDIFLLPSLFEGLPFAVIEAMHAGLPIVASNSDGLAEAIRDGETGFLCSGADAVAGRLQRLVDDPDLRAQLASAAQTEARAQFTVHAMARKTLALYETLPVKVGPA